MDEDETAAGVDDVATTMEDVASVVDDVGATETAVEVEVGVAEDKEVLDEGAGELLPSWYTLSALICQYASWKAEGLFCTNALHVWPLLAAAQLWKALPAHEPQKVVSKMRL